MYSQHDSSGASTKNAHGFMKQCDASLGFKTGVRDAYNNCVCEDGKKLSGTQCVTPAE